MTRYTHQWVLILDGEGHEIKIYDTIVDDAHGRDASVKVVSEMRARALNRPKRRARPSTWLRLALGDAAARITAVRSIIDFGKEE